MQENRTDKSVLMKGIKIMILALLSLFLGPIFLHLALSNKEKPLYIPLLIVGCLICITAIILMFKGINTIMNSIFKNKNS